VIAGLPLPVTVVGPHGNVVASCGLDTYVAGYPLQSIQAACRNHTAGHALWSSLAAMAALLALVGASVSTVRGQRLHEEGPARSGGTGAAGWAGAN
jgi:hypothetical protein